MSKTNKKQRNYDSALRISLDRFPSRTLDISKHASLDGRGVRGRMDTCIRMAEFLAVHLKLPQYF